ncbi:transposase family protein [Streptomyces sp. NPDC056069]|uniref:transposase family protein n=1 Tax=Streptomyces sp. NPDC056069 TaxID=3345702 RepID=UPI0035E019D2
MVWISPALPGRTHDLTAARRHRIIATCIRPGIPVLADRGYRGADAIVAVAGLARLTTLPSPNLWDVQPADLSRTGAVRARTSR